jgi:hypothetical protein
VCAFFESEPRGGGDKTETKPACPFSHFTFSHRTNCTEEEEK